MKVSARSEIFDAMYPDDGVVWADHIEKAERVVALLGIDPNRPLDDYVVIERAELDGFEHRLEMLRTSVNSLLSSSDRLRADRVTLIGEINRLSDENAALRREVDRLEYDHLEAE